MNSKKKEIKKENYYFHVKCGDDILKKMCEVFRIRIQPMMLRALWYFRQGYLQRMSSIDLLVGWGGSSRTDACVIKLLCPSGNLSPKMHPAEPLWNFIVMCHRHPHFCLFISDCENSLHFWPCGQCLSGNLLAIWHLPSSQPFAVVWCLRICSQGKLFAWLSQWWESNWKT